MQIAKYSMGIGDRFGRQGVAQLRAMRAAADAGVLVVPVWNKSHREHSLTGTTPDNVRATARAAVAASEWRHPYHVDADHIRRSTVDGFIESSDFFTIDVADFIGASADDHTVESFAREMAPLRGSLHLPGVERPLEVTDTVLESIGRRYALAVREAGRTYRRIAEAKGAEGFITEVSLDEADDPQSPFELFFLLGALARDGVAVQTIAPKFVGKFLKGIDYVGDVSRFEHQFDAHLAAIRRSIEVFGLPTSLKISIHTGSDKFSLYPAMRRTLRRHHAGIHLKTAGTTWLEEVIGLAQSGRRGLDLAKRIYVQARSRLDELCAPYATVVEIDRARLPDVATVRAWSADDFCGRLRHDPSCATFSPDVRQMMHVAFKVAAELGEEFTDALDAARETIGVCVTANLLERHIRPLFGPRESGLP
jgi:hypothetical protein